MRTRRLALTCVLICLVVVGCSSDPEPPGQDAAGSAPSASTGPSPRFSVAPGAPMPTRVPTAVGLVTTRDPVSLQAEADGSTTLCIGPVLAMVGAKCRGPEVIGYDGPASEPVRLVGRFDGKRLYVTDVLPPGPDRDVGADLTARSRTPCPEPDGGWRITDRAKATGTAAGRAMKVARAHPGFAQFWYDRSFDSVPSVLNVAVAGDRDAAETALLEVWGGALCVSSADHSQDALKRIATEVFELPGANTAAVQLDEVHVELLYDDGSLQAWADATYGQGLVTISSALIPVS